MAYEKQNFARLTDAMNTNLVPTTGASGSLQVFSYRSGADAQAAILAADYFLPEYLNLKKGDIILAQGTDSFVAYHVSASTITTVTTVAGAWTGAVTIP